MENISLTSDVLKEAEARGFIYQHADLEGLDKRASAGPITLYAGFDATADSLHVGNLVGLMFLRLFQKHGHKVIALVGGATTRIGDPSDKDTQRKLLSPEQIKESSAGIRKNIETFLKAGEPQNPPTILDNSDWLLDLNYLDFLRDYGRHFSVNRMLTFESVKRRLDREQPLSFLEFNYMIFQAYDFLHLSRTHGCTLQLGGSDQWSNLLNGIDLIRRLDQKEASCLTTPLITNANGEKMGKTAQGAMWLSADKLSPYDYWQFWRNTQDADVGRFLRIFTELSLDDIRTLESLEGAALNEAKKTLANETTRLAHGDAAVQEARATAEKLFEHGSNVDLSALPTIEVSRAEIAEGIAAIDLLVQSDLAKSKGEARRLIRNGGARLNDLPISDENLLLTLEHMSNNGQIKLSAGKKRHALVTIL